MPRLTLIGYWRSEWEPQWPDPAWFVDPGWNPEERARVLAYLRAARVPWAAGGLSWCRFRCGIAENGSAEHTDGRFLWPQGLAHYVEQHSVRLPDEFTLRALAGPPPEHVVAPLDTEIDETWWMDQRGFRTGSSYLTPAARGRYVAVLRGVAATPRVVAALRKYASAQLMSVPVLRGHIEAGRELLLLDPAVDVPRPARLTELDALGIDVEFRADPVPPRGSKKLAPSGEGAG